VVLPWRNSAKAFAKRPSPGCSGLPWPAAVGGRGTLLGPVIGALLVDFGRSRFTAITPESWLFVLGGLFVFVTLFLPTGIVGTFDHGWRSWRERRASAEAGKGEAAPTADAQTDRTQPGQTAPARRRR